MRVELRRVGPLVLGVTATLGVLLGVRPVPVERLLAGYVIALAAIALVSLARTLGSTAEYRPVSPFEQALTRKPELPSRPPELVRIEREITLGTTSAGHLHGRLLPLLREAAIARLGAGFTRERLGDATWELLRPDRPEPVDRTAPGLPLRRVREIVAQLEQS